jgi:dihydrofolate synthase/folylpolyglutamate synthase
MPSEFPSMSALGPGASLAQWLARLEQGTARVIEMGLDRVSRVWKTLGLVLPFPVITVGGTNGKGSVCALLESIYACAGYRVGLYTSPHLLRYNERVRVAQREAADEALVEAFRRIEAARGSTPLTYFEFGTLAAMLIFIESRVDVAVLEVGLGGRLDAVNIFDNDCAVVTCIDFDHMEYLGNTREEIGFEKAGIFKRGRAAVCADPDPPAVIETHARDVGTDLLQIGRDFGYTAEGAHWTYWGYGVRRAGLPRPALAGGYQLRNAAAALAVVDELKERLPVAAGDIRRGLVEVRLPGRFQVLPGRPVVVLDVAHNPHAARALAENLASQGRFRTTFAVIGMFKDKDILGVARALKPRVDVWLAATLPGERGASAERIVQALRDAGAEGEVRAFSQPAAAFAEASARAREDDRIVVFGSFLTVAEIMQVHAQAGEPRPSIPAS